MTRLTQTGSLASLSYVKGKIATRSFFRHPGLAQAIDKPVKIYTNAWIGGWRWCAPRLECRDAFEGRDRNATLFRVAGLRLMTGQCKCRGEHGKRRRKVRIDRDRPAGPFDRLIVLLQREIVYTFAAIPKKQICIVRTEPYRLVKDFDALFILSGLSVCEAYSPNCLHSVRVQGERTFEFNNRIGEASLNPEYIALSKMAPRVVRVDGDRARRQFISPLQVGLGIGTAADQDREKEPNGQLS